MNIASTALPEIAQAFADDAFGKLVRSLKDHSAVVGVVGIGYVGLPLAVEKAKVGFPVLGFDRNVIRVDQVNHGFNYIRDVADADLARCVGSGILQATNDFDRLAECDVIAICVPTPLSPNKEPDISHIARVAAQIAQVLRPGQLICLESTTYPGTTEEVLLAILAQKGLVVGTDYFLAFSPERVDPGNKRYTTRNTSKVVGGVTPRCRSAAKVFYDQTIVQVVEVDTPRLAEMTKVFENTFRAVNIALVNEMTLLCDKLNINMWEVIDAAATKPFGIMRFEPGPGVGGHCIPLDPYYLSWKVRQYDFHVRFIELAGEINDAMPYFVRDKVMRALNCAGLALRDAKILIIGAAYKKDVEDWRESPVLRIMDLFDAAGAIVDYHDPLVSRFQDLHGKLRHSTPMTAEALNAADAVLILTDHSVIDWEFVTRHSRLLVDTRNATRSVKGPRDHVILL